MNWHGNPYRCFSGGTKINFTDASVLPAALGNPPTLILGPGEATHAHQTDEWCRVDKIPQAADIYLKIARSWCGV